MAGDEDKHDFARARSDDGGVELIARADRLAALVAAGWLIQRPLAALPGAEACDLAGRGGLYRFVVAGSRLLAKTMRHGGLVGRFRGDRFGSAARLEELLRLDTALARAQIAFAPLVAARVVRIAPRSFRLEVATAEVAGARDGLAFLAARPEVALRRAALRAAGVAIRALHAAGVDHADLNLKNLLVAGVPPRVVLIDLENSRQSAELPRAAALANLARLYRSARKLGLIASGRLSRADRAAFVIAYSGRAGFKATWRAIARRHALAAIFHPTSWRG